MGLAFLFLSALLARAEDFAPSNRLSGIGVERERMSEAVLDKRAELMIDSQTFTILRDPRAAGGAERVMSPKLQKVFRDAGKKSGLPPIFVSAVAYLESWGIANAESPAGPKGIMQIAEATARSMGLKVVRKTRYRVYKDRVAVKSKGKTRYKTVKRRVPYTVVVRDDRLSPSLAIPAAARYLARMEQKFGGRDWAVFAYHCGEGCVAEVQNVARQARWNDARPFTVAAAFFGSHPGFNRELYNVMRRHMDRDYSPTYYFRIRRAEQLLAMYAEDPTAFRKLAAEYRNRVNPDERAPHRLSVWLKPEDLEFQNCEDVKKNLGRKLARALDNPQKFGFSLRKTGPGAIGERDPVNREVYFSASPAALGALAYIAFETRRLHEAMDRKGERWVPLEVTALVSPRDYEERFGNGAGKNGEFASHCSGQVFDISTSGLPPGEREALDFILDDLGWHGYLGFVEEHSGGTLHIGPAPTGRDFFTRVFEDAVEAAR